RKYLTRRELDSPTRMPGAPVDALAKMGRIRFKPTKLAPTPCPVELVRLVTVQQVVLLCALLERVLDGKPHRDQADAVLAVRRIEARLIEVKDPAVPEAVQGCGGPTVERQNKQAEPAAVQGELTHVVVKRGQRGRMKAGRAPAPLPAGVMQRDQAGQRFTPLVV